MDNTLLATNDFVLRNILKTVERMNSGGAKIIMPAEEGIKSVLARNLPFEDIFKVLFDGLPDGREMASSVLADYRAHAKEEKYAPTTGAVDAVNWLNFHGIPAVLVTNRVKMLEERLVQAGFSIDQFLCVCQPESDEFRKPHPRSLDTALAAFKKKGITSGEIVLFGDHSDDFYPAFYNGLKFVAVLQGLVDADEFIGLGVNKNLIIEDLSDIQKSLEKSVEIEVYKNSLSMISALDGRHAVASFGIKEFFSEYALHKNRTKAEIEHLICLSEWSGGKVVRSITDDEKTSLREIYKDFSAQNAFEVLQYDHLGRCGKGPLEHDGKSVEMWISEKISCMQMNDLAGRLHLFVTSEDINNLAYKMMLQGAVNELFVPKVIQICELLRELAVANLEAPLMGRTHLQPASATTFGKVFGNYLLRLTRALSKLYGFPLFGKINGAVGNYNSFTISFPEMDWIEYSRELTKRLGMEAELWTDQRGTHTDIVAAFQIMQEAGNVARDLAVDLSLYAGIGAVFFSKVESHVGSSVMPHKINPWWAEVAEGNIKKANALINTFANELDVSRLQRDLSDHDLERSYGEAFGYLFVAFENMRVALDLLRVDKDFALAELARHPEIISEAIQTVMRVYGIPDSYEQIKKIFRGEKISSEELRSIVCSLKLPDEANEKIYSVLDPGKYTGLAVELAEKAVAFYDKFKLNSVGRYLEVK